jgi:hypothetical protein
MPRSAWTPIPGHILHGHAGGIQTGGGGALAPSSSGEFHRDFVVVQRCRSRWKRSMAAVLGLRMSAAE